MQRVYAAGAARFEAIRTGKVAARIPTQRAAVIGARTRGLAITAMACGPRQVEASTIAIAQRGLAARVALTARAHEASVADRTAVTAVLRVTSWIDAAIAATLPTRRASDLTLAADAPRVAICWIGTSVAAAPAIVRIRLEVDFSAGSILFEPT